MQLRPQPMLKSSARRRLSTWTRHACLPLVNSLTSPQSSLNRASSPQVVSSLDSRYKVAAQNSWIAGLGAYTGEIADEMILDIGARCPLPAGAAAPAQSSNCGPQVGELSLAWRPRAQLGHPGPQRAACLVR